MKPLSLRSLGIVAALAFAYYLAARLGLHLAFEGSNASPVWPPSGLAVGGLLLFGPRMLPAVAIGAFAANIAVFAANAAAPWTVTIAASLAIAAGNTLEAGLAGFMLRRWIGAHSPFDRLADVAKFLVVAVAASLASAAVGTATLVAAGIVAPAALATVALTWWIGDTVGILVVAPWVATLRDAARRRWSRTEALEAAALVGVVALLGVLVFVEPSTAAGADRRLAWLFMPCIAWAAFRHGAHGVASISMLVTGLAVAGTIRGLGPFARGDVNDALIVLQSFVALCVLTGLVLAADRSERARLNRRDARVDVGAPWFVLLASIGVTVVGWHLFAFDTERRAEDRFAAAVADVRERLKAQLTDAEQLLRGAAGLLATRGEIGRAEWQTYAQALRLAEQAPGIQGLGFARALLPHERAGHVLAVRGEGYADYTLQPDGERPFYTAIEMIHPFDERNRRTFGYDMYTEPVRREAMVRARDTGEPALSAKVTLLQEDKTGVQAGALLYLPVYRSGAVPASIEQRRAALVGWVYCPLRMDNLGRAALGRIVEVAGVAVEVRTANDGVLFRIGAAGGRPSTLRSSSQIELSGQTWTIDTRSLPAFESTIDLQKAQFALVAGVGLSLLLFALVRSLSLTRERALMVADDMTAALRESEAKFRSLAESASEAILITDSAGRLVSFNRSAQRMFGYAESEMAGHGITRLMPERYRAAHKGGLERLRAGGSPRLLGTTQVLTGRRSDGSEFPIELSLASWETGSGRFYGGIVRDITERERAATALREREQAAHDELTRRLSTEAELAAKNEALQRSNAELAQFAHVASHDLQEPLRTVASYTQLLLRRHRDKIEPEAREFLDFIGAGAARAQALIADLLNLARLDSSGAPARRVALEEVVEQVRRQLAAAIAESGAELTHDTLPEVYGDERQLGQMLQNLIANAIKFRGDAPPRVHVGAEALPGGAWRIAVADNGIGIDARHLPTLFRPFRRLHRDRPGTGIGLAICRKIAERHGGAIEVTSTLGRGSTFFVTIAAVSAETATAAAARETR